MLAFTFASHRGGGLFLGLGAAQLGILAVGLAVGFAGFRAGAPAAALGALAVAATLALGQVGGLYLWEHTRALAVGALAAATRRRWQAPPASHHLGPVPGVEASLPGCLAGVELRSGTGPLSGAGLVYDRADRSLTVTVGVPGVAFTLLSGDEQLGLLAGWGEVLRAFATERGPVVRVGWSDWAVPAALADHHAWAATQPGGPPAARDSYTALLGGVAGEATSHDVTVTVTVTAARSRPAGSGRPGSAAHLDRLEHLAAQAAADLTAALRQAGLSPTEPLTATQMALAVRERVDPFGWRPDPAVGTLVDRLGLGAVGPARADLARRHLTVDAASHRVYQILQLPQTPLPADWFRPVLQTTGLRRAITAVLEPVAPSLSRRRTAREILRLESDADTRVERGFRVSAAHRRAVADAETREQELISGFPEYTAALFVCVTAPDPDHLDEDCATLEATARQHGLLLRPRDGEHDLAWATSLPLGLGLTPAGLQ